MKGILKSIVVADEIGNFQKMHDFLQSSHFNETKQEIENSVHNKRCIFIGYLSSINGVL